MFYDKIVLTNIIGIILYKNRLTKAIGIFDVIFVLPHRKCALLLISNVSIAEVSISLIGSECNIIGKSNIFHVILNSGQLIFKYVFF